MESSLVPIADPSQAKPTAADDDIAGALVLWPRAAGVIMPEAPTPPVAPIGSELAAEDESFADLVQEFLDGLARRLADLEQALAEADCQRLRMLAHQLKGSGGGYGYPILTQQAAELERVAITGVVDECRRAVEALRSLVSRLVAKAPG